MKINDSLAIWRFFHLETYQASEFKKRFNDETINLKLWLYYIIYRLIYLILDKIISFFNLHRKNQKHYDFSCFFEILIGFENVFYLYLFSCGFFFLSFYAISFLSFCFFFYFRWIEKFSSSLHLRARGNAQDACWLIW